MKSLRIFPAVTLLGCLIFSSSTFAVVDANAPVVQLRALANGGCVEAGVTINNCFTDLTSLNSWIVSRAPSATAPLLVNIGPGTFNDVAFRCVNEGYITLRGAGRQNTTIGPNPDTGRGMFLRNCTNLDVLNLKIAGSYAAIDWGGTGITTWTDVEVSALGIGWYENSGLSCVQQQTKHYWFSSRIEAQPFFSNVVAYGTYCGESWIFGSELIASANDSWNITYPLWVSQSGEAHIYGSVLRAIITSPGLPSGVIAAAYAQGGKIHLHGTGIDVNSQVAVPIVALKADTGGMIHANGVGYFMSTAGGAAVTRIQNNGGMVMAPYLWEEGMTPQNITSANGSDMQVITGNADGHPHLAIYDSSCASKWFDTVAQSCR